MNNVNSPQEDDIIQNQFTTVELALAEGNSIFALKLCSSIKQKLPLHPRVYELASDAYLSKKLFYEAECSLLQSLMLGGKSLKHYFNLSTFASILSLLRQKIKNSKFNFQQSWDLADSLSSPTVVNE